MPESLKVALLDLPFCSYAQDFCKLDPFMRSIASGYIIFG